MKFGVREICDVVLKAKAAQKIGNKVFYKNEPVLYFDSLKTSSMEGAATTVYAQGGRGNARLVAWEGERTVTFTMEDALISPAGFSILTGAGLIDAKDKPVIMHTTEQTDKVEKIDDYVEITLSKKPYVKTVEGVTVNDNVVALNPKEDYIYIMVLDDHGEVKSEPYIASELASEIVEGTGSNSATVWKVRVHGTDEGHSDDSRRINDLSEFTNGCVVLVDYYVEYTSGAFQVDITPDKFGGNFYLEASTLFRDTNGVDMPAEFVIPNCKVQSNFTFTIQIILVGIRPRRFMLLFRFLSLAKQLLISSVLVHIMMVSILIPKQYLVLILNLLIMQSRDHSLKRIIDKKLNGRRRKSSPIFFVFVVKEGEFIWLYYIMIQKIFL